MKKISFYVNPLFFASAAFFLSGELYHNYLYALLFAFLHEAGHLCAMLCFGVVPDRITIEIQGIKIEKSWLSLTHFQECVLALAGPFVNLLFMCFSEKTSLAFIINSGLFLINLIPLSILDGGRFLFNFISIFTDEQNAERCVRISGVVTAILLVFLLVICCFTGYANASVVIFMAIMIISVVTDLLGNQLERRLF